jgi:alkaline phosphatase
MADSNLPTYVPDAPTVGEMTAKALELLGSGHFYLVVEEEGTDNFGNVNNAAGVLDALKRADEAFGVSLEFIEKNPDTFLLTAADSSAGNMDTIGFSPEKASEAATVAAGKDPNGAPLGFDAEGKPFLAAPDKSGRRLPFVVVWGSRLDTSGGILARAAGKGADAVAGTLDNTGIYRVMKESLFDKN